MAITVSYYGTTKPEKGTRPLWTRKLDKKPFQGKNPTNWMDGKHTLRLRPDAREAGADGKDGTGEELMFEGVEDVRFDMSSKQLQVKIDGSWQMIEGGQAVSLETRLQQLGVI